MNHTFRSRARFISQYQSLVHLLDGFVTSSLCRHSLRTKTHTAQHVGVYFVRHIPRQIPAHLPLLLPHPYEVFVRAATTYLRRKSWSLSKQISIRVSKNTETIQIFMSFAPNHKQKQDQVANQQELKEARLKAEKTIADGR